MTEDSLQKDSEELTETIDEDPEVEVVTKAEEIVKSTSIEDPATSLENAVVQGFEKADVTPETETLTDSVEASPSNSKEASSSEAKPTEPALASEEKGKPRAAVIAAIVAIVVIICVAVGFFVHSENEKAAAEKARIAEIENYNAYIDNLESARFSMLQGCATAEDAGNLMMSVWRNAIFEDDVDSWPDDAKPYFATDFNDALSLLFASDVYKGYLKDLKSNEETVDGLMKELRNPPAGCERAYDATQDFYASYKSLTKLVSSPSGSYQTTSQSFSSLDSEAVTQFEKIDTLIPDKKEVK